MCSQDDAPDTKKHFTRAPVQDGSLPRECCSSFHLRSYNPLFFFSANRDPCWCALDSLPSSHLSFTDIFCKRRSGPEECPTKHVWAANPAACTPKLLSIFFFFFFFFAHLIFGLWRWRAETPAGLSSVGGRAILRGWGRGGEDFWQQLQRGRDTSGSGRLGLACLCPGLWWLLTGT